MIAANIVNKQLRKADKGWSSSLGIGRRANNSPKKKTAGYEVFTGPRTWILWNDLRNGKWVDWASVDWMHVAQERDLWQALVNTVMNLWVP